MRERTELQRLELRISDLQQLNEAMKKATDRNATDLTYAHRKLEKYRRSMLRALCTRAHI